MQQGNIASRNHAVSLLDDKIKATASVVSDIQAQIDEASDPVKICYTAASDLDMVPGEFGTGHLSDRAEHPPEQEPIAIRAGND